MQIIYIQKYQNVYFLIEDGDIGLVGIPKYESITQSKWHDKNHLHHYIWSFVDYTYQTFFIKG